MNLKRKKIEFQRLVNCDGGYGDEVALDVLQWMFETGQEYRQPMGGRGSSQGVFELLHNMSSIRSKHSIYYSRYGISSNPVEHSLVKGHYRPGIVHYQNYFRTGLKLAFLRAIVADDVLPCVKQWRKDNNISLGSYRMLMLPEEDPSYPSYLEGVEVGSLVHLLGYTKRTLTTQLNSHWAEAVEINSILMSPSPKGWLAILNYGFGSSIWSEYLCDKPMGFRDTVKTAILRIEQLTK